MSALQNFFLFCSGSNFSILKRTPTDINKYVGIGATIFFTGLLAFIAGGFAIYSIFHSYVTAIIFGLVWGLMIFNLDRYIVSSMKNRGSRWSNFISATPRILLAIVIAMVISKPLELKIFQSEINAELVNMEQEKYKTQEDLLNKRFVDEIATIKSAIIAAESKLSAATSHQQSLLQEAMAEADGTGGSGIRNMGPIYKAKMKLAIEAESKLAQLTSTLAPEIDRQNQRLIALEEKRTNALTELKKVPLNGFAAQLDALGRLSSQSETIWWASLFVTLLFICIETTPILAKLISNRSPYDLVLHKLEHSYEVNHRSIVTKLSLETNNDLNYLTKTSEYQTDKIIAAENELFLDALQKKVKEEKEKSLGWADILKGKRLRTEL